MFKHRCMELLIQIQSYFGVLYQKSWYFKGIITWGPKKIVLGVNDLQNSFFRHKSTSNKYPRRLPSGVLRYLKIGHIVGTLILIIYQSSNHRFQRRELEALDLQVLATLSNPYL